MNQYPLDTILPELSYGNTGTHSVKFNPDRIIGMILTAKNRIFTAEQAADMITELKNSVISANLDTRVYPIHRLTLDKDESKDTTFADMGYDIMQPVMEGKPDYTFKVLNSDIELNNQLRKFNGGNYRVILIDANQTLIGTSTANPGEFVGFDTNFIWTAPFKFNDGKNPTLYKIRISLTDPLDLNDKIQIIRMKVNIEQNVKGNINAVLKVLDLGVSHVVTVGAYTNQNGIDLHDLYAGELSYPDAWVITDPDTGSIITPSSITENANLKGWDILLSGTMNVNISLATPDVLAGLHVGEFPANGIESPVYLEGVSVS